MCKVEFGILDLGLEYVSICTYIVGATCLLPQRLFVFLFFRLLAWGTLKPDWTRRDWYLLIVPINVRTYSPKIKIIYVCLFAYIRE